MNNLKKPEWLKKHIRNSNNKNDVLKILTKNKLNTVCQSAGCPNLSECFQNKVMTFLILGDRCTRNCKFCKIKKIKPELYNFDTEIKNIIKTVKHYDLKYVTITSVTRDDLEDYGISVFNEIIFELHNLNVGCEVLIPDLYGNVKLLKNLVLNKPDVINHNIEMVESLYKEIRPLSDYKRSLELLKSVKKINAETISKTGFMLGLGETESEVKKLIKDIFESKVDILTIGQYLQPSRKHYHVKEYIKPEKFEMYKQFALNTGIKIVESGSFVRSSYNAKGLYEQVLMKT